MRESGKRLAILSLAAFLTATTSSSRPTRAESPDIYALTGARVVVSPGEVIDGGTVVVRDGLIEAVGRAIEPPPDATLIDLTGRTVTAGLIDACSDVGLRKAKKEKEEGRAEQKEDPPGAHHPIPLVRPELRVVDVLAMDEDRLEKHRAMGFTSALVLPASGIFRGQPALIDLGREGAGKSILRPAVGQSIAFERGRFGRGYPTSLMGSITAIRQTLLDASRHAVWEERYRANPRGMRRPEFVSANEALGDLVSGASPAIFDIDRGADVPRAIALAREFSLKAVVVASGLESSEPGAIDSIKASGTPVILPLAFPEEPPVTDPDEALGVPLRDLESWEAAPGNPALFEERGISFALGTCRLEKVDEFLPNLRKAIERGLSRDTALAALTTAPARMLGVEDILGRVEKGMIANLTVFEGEGDLFSKEVRVSHVFIDGVKIEIEKKDDKECSRKKPGDDR